MSFLLGMIVGIWLMLVVFLMLGLAQAADRRNNEPHPRKEEP